MDVHFSLSFDFRIRVQKYRDRKRAKELEDSQTERSGRLLNRSQPCPQDAAIVAVLGPDPAAGRKPKDLSPKSNRLHFNWLRQKSRLKESSQKATAVRIKNNAQKKKVYHSKKQTAARKQPGARKRAAPQAPPSTQAPPPSNHPYNLVKIGNMFLRLGDSSPSLMTIPKPSLFIQALDLSLHLPTNAPHKTLEIVQVICFPFFFSLF